MNIRNFCIFPDGNSYWPDKEKPKRKPKHLRGTSWTLTKELDSGRFLWLPLELPKRPKMEMHNPVIVFNITELYIFKWLILGGYYVYLNIAF